MSNVFQHILALILVASCVLWVVRGLFMTLRSQQGGLGKCCEKGCAPKSQTQSEPKVMFIPIENLTKKRS